MITRTPARGLKSRAAQYPSCPHENAQVTSRLRFHDIACMAQIDSRSDDLSLDITSLLYTPPWASICRDLTVRGCARFMLKRLVGS